MKTVATFVNMRNPSAAEAFSRLSLAVGQAKSENLELLPSVNHAFNLMQQIGDFRLERLSAVGGQVTPVFWGVLLLGAVISLGHPAFFTTEHVAAQILMTGGARCNHRRYVISDDNPELSIFWTREADVEADQRCHSANADRERHWI
jgi:hypothetical protein